MHETKTLGAGEITLSYEYDSGEVYWARFLELVLARDLPHERFVRWQTKAPSLDDMLEYATHSSKLSWGSALLLDLEDEVRCLAVVSLNSGSLSVHLAAETVAALNDAESFLRERLPVRVATEDQMVPISFWSCGGRGAAESSRSISVPSWADIRGNYPPRVARQLDVLMRSEYRPEGRGQLLLWYGEPGTGKTYGLRALAWQWRGWCSFQYVTDPEAFFGRPEYMLRVLAPAEHRRRDHRPGTPCDRPRDDERRPAPAAPGRVPAWSLPGEGRVLAIHAGGGGGVVRAERRRAGTPRRHAREPVRSRIGRRPPRATYDRVRSLIEKTGGLS